MDTGTSPGSQNAGHIESVADEVEGRAHPARSSKA
jgi:hypothetical protein